MLYLLWQENLQSFIVWVILSAVVCLSPKKKLIPAMRSFKGTIIISAEFSQPSILSTVLHVFLTLKFADIQFCQRTFFKHNSEHQSPWNKLPMEESIFSVQHQLYWSESNRVKQILFRRNIFFSEYLVVWTTYFFLKTTAW